MRFKWVNVCFLLWAWIATAEVTVTPVAPYLLVKDNVYFASFPPFDGLLVDTGFKNFDFLRGQFDTINTKADAAFDNAIFFDLTSDKDFTEEGTKKLVITTTAKVSSGDAKPIPVVYAGNAICVLNGNCQGKLDVTPSGSTSTFTYALAARYTAKSTLRVGFFPADICMGSQSQGVTVEGCTAGKVNSTSGAVTQMTLTFFFGLAETSEASGPVDSAQEKSTPIVVTFTNSKAKLTCDPDKLKNGYFPGDQQIQLASDFINITNNTSSAPVDTVLVVGKDGGPVITDKNLLTANNLLQRVPYAAEVQTVKGFTNTSTGNDHTYEVTVLTRDAAGVISDFSPSCVLPKVQTTDIQGFLSESRCFVASAAFRDQRAGAVMLLREFRDGWLMQRGWGRKFVHWYYRAGPPVAVEVLDHPVLRLPALRVLLPLQISAWLVLHPLVLFVWSLFSLLALLSLSRSRLVAPPRWVLGLIAVFLISSLGGCAGKEGVSEGDSSAGSYTARKKEELLKKDQEENESASPQAEPQKRESYTEKKKKELLAQDAEEDSKLSAEEKQAKQKSYIDTLKESDPKKFPKDAPPQRSYTEELKEKLEPSAPGGAIQALKEGRSELHPRKQGEIHHLASLKLSALSNKNIISRATGRSFTDIFGKSWSPDFQLVYEYQLFRSELLGSFGMGFFSGLSVFSGKGLMKFDLTNSLTRTKFGLASRTSFNLIPVPLGTFLNFRLNVLRYIRPYVQAGPTVLFMFETRSDDLPMKRDYSTLLTFQAGVNFMLDWIEAKPNWDLYEEMSIHHSYLTVELSQQSALSGPVSYQPTSVFGGLTYEF